jgi:hypothetical protein
MTYPGHYWLLIDPETELPSNEPGSACSAYYGLSDKPVEGNWVMVCTVPEPRKDESE